MARRVRVVAGDLADVPPLPDDLDAVVHCAGDVSFDPPIQEAFATNVLGVQALLERVRAAPGRVPLYLHVSTAYVSGNRRGIVAEAPWSSTTPTGAPRPRPGPPRSDRRRGRLAHAAGAAPALAARPSASTGERVR